MTHDEIFNTIRDILTNTFDLPSDKVTLDAQLRDDLDLDSIDAVDLIVQLKPLVGTKLHPDAFKSVRTVGDVVNALHDLQATSQT